MSPKWTDYLPPWYYATRALGVAFCVVGLGFDHSAERGTLILTGAGLLGLDKVARSDGEK